MSNQSYCRFRNTLGDLRDCAEDLDAGCLDDKVEPLSDEERRAAMQLLKLCARLTRDFEVEP
jgi:hypothetical protein